MRPLIFSVFILLNTLVFGQGCYIDLNTSSTKICSPSNVEINASVYSSTTSAFNSLNDTLTTLWNFDLPQTFQGNSCNPHPMNYQTILFNGEYNTTTSAVSHITSDSIYVACTDAKLHFDLAVGLGDFFSGCDGADGQTEGLLLEYSNDGGISWIGFKYLRPDGVIYDVPTTNPPPAIPYGYTFYETWKSITIDLPNNTLNSYIKIRFSQNQTSGQNSDYHLLSNLCFTGIGITNTCTNTPYTLQWNTGQQNLDTIQTYIADTNTFVQAFALDINNDTVCASLPISFTFPDSLVFDIQQTNLTAYCPEQNLQLNFSELDGGERPYTFSYPGVFTPHLNNKFTYDQPYITDTSAYFVLTVTDNCGMSASDSVLIQGPSYQETEFFLSPDSTIVLDCPTAYTTFQLDSIHTNYGNPYISTNGLNLGNNTYKYGQYMSPGDSSYFTIETQDNCGYTYKDSVLIYKQVNSPIEVFVSETPNSILCFSDTFELTVDSIIGGIAPYQISSPHAVAQNGNVFTATKGSLSFSGNFKLEIQDACNSNYTEIISYKQVNWNNTYNLTTSIVENLSIGAPVFIMNTLSDINYSLLDCSNNMSLIPTPNGISQYALDTMETYAIAAEYFGCRDTSVCIGLGLGNSNSCNNFLLADDYVICPNDSTTVSLFTNNLPLLHQETFPTNQLPTGWSINSSTYTINDNTCVPHPEGFNYIHFNGTGTSITTPNLPINCGNIALSFDLQAGYQGAPSPCEGPDLKNEGIIVEYSTDNGVNWNFVNYIYPTGILSNTIDSSYASVYSPGGSTSNLLNWIGFYLPINSNFTNQNIKFRFTELSSTSYTHDYYSLTNFKVYGLGSSCSNSFNIQWNNGIQNQNSISVQVNDTTEVYADIFDINNNFLCSTDTLTLVNYLNNLDFNIVQTDSVINCNNEILTFSVNSAYGGKAPYVFNFLNQDSTTNFQFSDSNFVPASYTYPITITDQCNYTTDKNVSFYVSPYYFTDDIITNVDLSHGSYGILYADTAGVDQVQWIDCDSSFLPVASQFNTIPFEFPYEGNFALIIETAGCIDTTDCYQSNGYSSNPNAGLLDKILDQIVVSPNPFTDKLVIESFNQEILQIHLTNATGQYIDIHPTRKEGVIEINSSGLAAGSYFLNISAGSEIKVFKLIKL